MASSPRDLIGYGNHPPHPQWPNDARIAVQFVINYEEGTENCTLHGDNSSEIIDAQPLEGKRHMSMESIYAYGSRAGFWRLHRLFSERAIPVTVFGGAMALARNPDAVKAMQDAEWEIASHGYRSINDNNISEEEEREHVTKALEIHQRMTGEAPQGWYIGRTSEQSRALILEQTTPLYDADSYADDLPYWVEGINKKPHLIVPYTLDVNDMCFATNHSVNASDQFYNYLKDSFDTLYEEGATAPKMMSIGLHCQLAGRPGCIATIKRFLDYLENFNYVWACRRVDIAKHWYEKHYPA